MEGINKLNKWVGVLIGRSMSVLLVLTNSVKVITHHTRMMLEMDDQESHLKKDPIFGKEGNTSVANN